MQKLKDLYKNLKTISSAHETLKLQFRKFAKCGVSKFQSDDSPISGISVCLHLDNNYFDVNFVGHTLRFVFSSQIDNSSTLPDSTVVGVVKCLRVDTLNEQNTQIGIFTFKASGKTDLEYWSKNEPACINDGEEANYIFLHFLYENINQSSTLDGEY